MISEGSAQGPGFNRTETLSGHLVKHFDLALRDKSSHAFLYSRPHVSPGQEKHFARVRVHVRARGRSGARLREMIVSSTAMIGERYIDSHAVT